MLKWLWIWVMFEKKQNLFAKSNCKNKSKLICWARNKIPRIPFPKWFQVRAGQKWNVENTWKTEMRQLPLLSEGCHSQMWRQTSGMWEPACGRSHELIMLISSQISQRLHIGRVKSDMVAIFTPQKSAST